MNKAKKVISVLFLLPFLFILIITGEGVLKISRAVSSWQAVDINGDGRVNALDVIQVIRFYGCPLFGNCGGSSPTPTGSQGGEKITSWFETNTNKY